jgi:polar amino acid transport system substrate-binding protein
MPETRSGLLRAFATGRSHDSAGGAVRAGPTGRCRRLLARLALLVPALLAAGAVPAAAQVDPIDNIQRRGTLVVGVKNDYPLFGSVNPAGQLVGLEPDLAADLARRLNVSLTLVGVTSANRFQRLQDGTIDVMIATLGDTEQRRKIVTIVEPNYYASGVNVMTPPSSRIREWSELRGQRVCATQGTYFNRLMAERYLLDLQNYNSNRDARLALKDGRCVAWLYDDTAIAGDLQDAEWAGWRMPLQSVLLTPWAVALHPDARGSRLERLVGDAVADWHRTGFLIDAERKWNIPPGVFLQRTRDLWSETDGTGQPLCRRQANGQWPEVCRNQALLASNDASGVLRIGLVIKERTGLDLSVLYDRYDRNVFLFAVLQSLALIAACLVGGFASGVVGAILLDRRIPVVTHLASAAIAVTRMTPPLLQIYVVFFGVGSFVIAHWGLSVDGAIVAAICLSFYAGAGNAVAINEASEFLRARIPDFRLSLATLPQALRLSQGSIVSTLVNIVKATGMASAIAVPELISASTYVMAERGNASVMMNVLMVVYLLLVLAVVRLLDRLQKWFASPEREVRPLAVPRRAT